MSVEFLSNVIFSSLYKVIALPLWFVAEHTTPNAVIARLAGLNMFERTTVTMRCSRSWEDILSGIYFDESPGTTNFIGQDSSDSVNCHFFRNDSLRIL